MRHSIFNVLALVTTILFTACKKEIQPQNNSVREQKNIAAGQRSVKAESKNLVLETFTHTVNNFSRQYHFMYTPNGRLDSIVVSQTSMHYTYNVFYKGSRIDSVHLEQNGIIVSTVTNFQYKGNLITGFDYFDRLRNQPYPTHYAITYDQQKRISSIDRMSSTIVEDHKEFTYDVNDNLIVWNETGFLKYATFTYDEKLNPLHFIPELFAIMFEEQWIWEYSFSLHNSITETYLNGPTVTYQNQYNNSGQIVSKVFTDINSNEVNTFSFTYR